MSEEDEEARWRPECTEHYVACVDILGYKKMVEDAVREDRGAGKISQLQAALEVDVNRFRSMFVPPKPASAAVPRGVRVLSDTIVYAEPIIPGEEGFGALRFVGRLVWLVERLTVDHGLFVRGAAVVGLHFDGGDVLFSPAVIDAYGTQERIALYPRVLVDAELRRRYVDCAAQADARYRPLYLDCLWCDDDGHYFLNYLNAGGLYLAVNEWRRGQLLKHKRLIEERLQQSEDDPRIRAKYVWSARYHNAFCEHVFATEAATESGVYRVRHPTMGPGD